jgi:hypothetical protein
MYRAVTLTVRLLIIDTLITVLRGTGRYVLRKNNKEWEAAHGDTTTWYRFK